MNTWQITIQTLITELSRILGNRLNEDWKSTQLIEGLSRNLDVNYLPLEPADESAISQLNQYIWERRASFDPATIDSLIVAIGTFMGECILARCGGRWKETDVGAAVELNQDLTVFPFHRVRECFLVGSFDYSLRDLYLTALSRRRPRKIDATFLPSGYRVGGDKGLVAEFYPDGQLRSLKHYVDGSYTGYWHLHLYYGVERGVVQCGHVSESYVQGAYSIDAHIDTAHSQEHRCDFIEWVQNWINSIANPSPEPQSAVKQTSKASQRAANSLVLDIQELHGPLVYDAQMSQGLTQQIHAQVEELREEESDAYSWYYWRDASGHWGCDLVNAEALALWDSEGRRYAQLLDKAKWVFIARDSTSSPGKAHKSRRQ